MPLLYTTIVSGSAVSGTVDLSQYPHLICIGVPGVMSAALIMQGNWDSGSAGFQRLLETRIPTNSGSLPGSGDLTFATGPGSRMVMWPLQALITPPYVRLETTVIQSDVRTFVVLAR